MWKKLILQIFISILIVIIYLVTFGLFVFYTNYNPINFHLFVNYAIWLLFLIPPVALLLLIGTFQYSCRK
jgi:hypothetical protein